ncbi:MULTISPECIES: phosphatase PAP2 family protein [unclassified Streptomyces]|uniref:phosphatase PAP2 family protein n=1 Tax=unclassified Streptomyces TaxID=2593676 RepID=UPI00225B0C5F|nr:MULTISPECIES: phosphatase PAP2 family protein [unclassified Streptomyces]WSP54720.1 phosphatase PAP2 family protein [Streptomyces sp. NBC_01241]WSU24601.1 phosphatase PAP2 family protein [Streptomyces sp. NBC_01108]MCX4786278.1 phosphatase PAP2 family protein [Streptomyces sp. NBC_01221]MCX4797864.1 phosphatase PAP2 family protein [Streptomyces sp. NBC_01242]WSJ39136.1 phosphatase PAP2 family protein [Streptomyces sp. NBC_01321]
MGELSGTSQEARLGATPSPIVDEAAPTADAEQNAGRRDGGPPGLRSPHPLRSLRSPRRPRFWFEILLLAASYWVYSLVRNAVPEQRAEALHNAGRIWSVETHLGIAVEQAVNHAVNSVTWLIVSMNYYYATLHFVVTVCVLVWLFHRHPGRYAAARLALFATTAVALLGYYLYPLAPPRLMSGGHFIDTVVVHQTWGSMASGNFKNMSNQYAAMPSMHIGWSLWCGLTLYALAAAPWVRVLGLLYPAVTLLVIVSTANHFWLDALGGMLCLAVGYAASYAWYGSLPHHLAKRVPLSLERPRPVGLSAGAAGHN